MKETKQKAETGIVDRQWSVLHCPLCSRPKWVVRRSGVELSLLERGQSFSHTFCEVNNPDKFWYWSTKQLVLLVKYCWLLVPSALSPIAWAAVNGMSRTCLHWTLTQRVCQFMGNNESNSGILHQARPLQRVEGRREHGHWNGCKTNKSPGPATSPTYLSSCPRSCTQHSAIADSLPV